MDLIEDIGPILGIVAFLGFAILALLIVLQAREVRRLREWAGRAPERSREAADGVAALAQERGDEPGPADETHGLRERITDALGPRWDALDRRLPVDPRWLLAATAALAIAAGVITGGFGLAGEDEPPPRQAGGQGGGGSGDGNQQRERRPTVAVLNATQIDDSVAPVPAVAGIADVVAAEVVEPAGFRVTERSNAPAGEATSVIMFEPGAEAAAQELATAIEADLGSIATEPITPEVSAVAANSELVLLVGQDDADFTAASL